MSQDLKGVSQHGDTDTGESNGGDGKDDDDEEKEGSCGWGPFRPAGCQRFRDPRWLLFCLCWVSFIQGMIVGGFVSVSLSTIEKRYELSSTESGLMPSMYDIASVICLVPVSYFGGIGKKSRYLGIGLLVLGVSSIIFAIPHFTSGLYQAGSDDKMLCDASRQSRDCKVGGEISNYKYLFYIALFIGGAGGSPIFTLGPTFLDANVPNRLSSLYIAIFHSFNIVGPGVGFLAGGAFLEIYVDIDKLGPDSINIDSTNTRFVGAWWIGYILAGILCIMVAIPLYGFPSELPGSATYRQEKDREVHRHSEKSHRPASAQKKKLSLRRVFRSLKTILRNPTYICLSGVLIVEGTLIAGYSNFLPKVLEVLFNLPSSTAALYVGVIAIVAGATGTFIGGYIVKKFDLHVRGILRFSIALVFVGILCYLVFISNCRDTPFAGVNIDYFQSSTNQSGFFGTFQTNTCHNNCSCNMEVYNPVCGDDKLTYFSPCHAGCSKVSISDDPWKYSNCSCIGQGGSTAVLGACENSCILLPVYLCLVALVMISTFAMTMPSLTASLRCVPQDERSLALGLQWLFAKVIGFIPGPVVFGALLDKACLLWQSKCDKDGSCFYYDVETLTYYLLAISVVGKSLSMLFFICALYTYKTSNDEKEVEVSVGTPRHSRKDLSKSRESVRTNGTRKDLSKSRESFQTNGTIGTVSALVENSKIHSYENGSITNLNAKQNGTAVCFNSTGNGSATVLVSKNDHSEPSLHSTSSDNAQLANGSRPYLNGSATLIKSKAENEDETSRSLNSYQSQSTTSLKSKERADDVISKSENDDSALSLKSEQTGSPLFSKSHLNNEDNNSVKLLNFTRKGNDVTCNSLQTAPPVGDVYNSVLSVSSGLTDDNDTGPDTNDEITKL